MAGELQTYYLVERGSRYYVKQNLWALKAHAAAFLDEETATKISRRYPGSFLSKMGGYAITYRTFEELEPDSAVLLQQAVTIAKRDGHSKEHILMVVERDYNAAI